MIEKMKKNRFASVLVGVILVVGIYLVISNSNLMNDSTSDQNEPEFTPTKEAMPENAPGPDPLNSSYIIEKQMITLVDGFNEQQIPNSSTKIITQVWGVPVATDVEGNEVNNPALIITQDPGGSGTFYYTAASVYSEEGYYGTNGILLGDRISPQTQEILSDGTIVVNYVDRAEGASMSDEPTEAVSRYFKVEGRNLIEVENPNL